MMAPMDDPDIATGRMPSSSSVSMMWMWERPRAPPPPKATATVGRSLIAGDFGLMISACGTICSQRAGYCG